MKKKEFKKPSVDVVVVNSNTIIATSGGANLHDQLSGYGDGNGELFGK